MLRNWWTDADRATFDKLRRHAGRAVRRLLPARRWQDLRQRPADAGREHRRSSAGCSLAYRAYKLSLNGKAAPVIDGLTGDQRFFLAWAQVWRCAAARSRGAPAPADRSAPAPRSTGSTASSADVMPGTRRSASSPTIRFTCRPNSACTSGRPAELRRAGVAARCLTAPPRHAGALAMDTDHHRHPARHRRRADRVPSRLLDRAPDPRDRAVRL